MEKEYQFVYASVRPSNDPTPSEGIFQLVPWRRTSQNMLTTLVIQPDNFLSGSSSNHVTFTHYLTLTLVSDLKTHLPRSIVPTISDTFLQDPLSRLPPFWNVRRFRLSSFKGRIRNFALRLIQSRHLKKRLHWDLPCRMTWIQNTGSQFVCSLSFHYFYSHTPQLTEAGQQNALLELSGSDLSA